jgi:proteasome lid subunit RPN8/RPN11
VDPIAYLQAERRATREGVLLLGIFHSHPDHPAIPSEHDLAAAHPFFSYTIVSLMEGVVSNTRSYQLIDGSFVEEQIGSYSSQ